LGGFSAQNPAQLLVNLLYQQKSPVQNSPKKFQYHISIYPTTPTISQPKPAQPELSTHRTVGHKDGGQCWSQAQTHSQRDAKRAFNGNNDFS
jgi:hypothetical protein